MKRILILIGSIFIAGCGNLALGSRASNPLRDDCWQTQCNDNGRIRLFRNMQNGNESIHGNWYNVTDSIIVIIPDDKKIPIEYIEYIDLEIGGIIFRKSKDIRELSSFPQCLTSR